MLINPQQIISWLIVYKYLVIFPVTVVEGPIVTIIAGFLAAHGYLNVYLVYLVIVSGDLTGDMFYYSLGRWGRKKSLIKWERLIGITDERIKKLETHFEKHSGKTILFGKVSHGIGSAFLIAAGIAKMPVKDFLWFNLLGTLPKSLLLLVTGYYFGQAYMQIKNYFDYTALFFIGGLILLLLLSIIFVNLKKIFRNYLA